MLLGCDLPTSGRFCGCMDTAVSPARRQLLLLLLLPPARPRSPPPPLLLLPAATLSADRWPARAAVSFFHALRANSCAVALPGARSCAAKASGANL